MKILAVRFEGTIVTASPAEAAALDWGDPIETAVDALRSIYDTGKWEIIIVSTAAGTSRGATHLISWLQEHEVPYDDIHLGFSLPVFDVLIDDKSLAFDDKTLKLLGVGKLVSK